MTPWRRWLVVVLGTALLVGVPLAVRTLPASGSQVSTARLLADVRAGLATPWSGYVETEGSLLLPDADRFSDVGALFGERTRLRVWWRSAEHWRVDQLLTAGEDDLVHDGEITTRWSYEGNKASSGLDPEIRLPRTADLVPPVLAERLARGLGADDVRRIEPRRVAGLSAAGLRLTPPTDQSSIDHADVWLDPGSGVVLRVEVHGADGVAFAAETLDVDTTRPSVEDVAFRVPPGAETELGGVLDIADAANQYAPVRPPATVAGLAKSPTSDRAVGVYGEGMTQVIAIPLRDREADALRDQLAVTPDVVSDNRRTLVTVGPLSVLMTGSKGDGGWLLAGTLTRTALEAAAADVVDGFVYVDDER